MIYLIYAHSPEGTEHLSGFLHTYISGQSTIAFAITFAYLQFTINCSLCKWNETRQRFDYLGDKKDGNTFSFAREAQQSICADMETPVMD